MRTIDDMPKLARPLPLSLDGADANRFWTRVNVFGDACTDDACWEWLRGKTQSGYGQFKLNGRTVKAHRLAYQLLTGIELRSDLELDHLCRNRACVNPDHLEEVSARVNGLRGVGIAALNARKQCCPRCGSEFTSFSGGRRCRTCGKQQSSAYHIANKEHAHAQNKERYAANREAIRERQRARHEANRDQINALARARYAAKRNPR